MGIWLHLMLGILLSYRPCQAQLVRCDMPADVVFLLDASDSIEPYQWEQEKDFVGILIDSLAVERHAINVGLIVYSTEIGQVVDLQPFKTKQQLKLILPTLLQTSQGTDTARAVHSMRQMMQNQAREGATRIAVVITDGRSENSTATIQEAVYARQLDNIIMVALGVGNETYIDELQDIAYDPYRNRLFTVQDFAQLQGVVEELRNLICEEIPVSPPTTTTTVITTTTTPLITAPVLPPIACPRPADVVFVLDGSFSITPSDWALGRVFVSALVQSLSVDIDAIHTGIIVYSSDIGDIVPLKPFLDKAALQQKVSGLRQPPLSRTNTALGLRHLRNMLRQQGRKGVPHIGIVITDGKSSNVQSTISEARQAKQADGISLLVVGVGQDTLELELRAMASSPDTLFNVTGFSALFDIAETLAKLICFVIAETTTTTTTTTIEPAPLVPDLCKECLVEGSVGYNRYPPSCSQYVACYPEANGGYRAEVKDCPFGLYWSSESVACVDSVHVNCSADPCRGQPNGWSHTAGTKGCGQYWSCRGERSVPVCCPRGQRFSLGSGCRNDGGCEDHCSLNVTLAGSGACPYRPIPNDPFGYLQLIPGQGAAVRPCAPGTVYSHQQCHCLHNTPSLGCVPSLHYNFNGSFDDRSKHQHAAHVNRVLLTQNGTAFFNGSGYLQVNSLPSNEFQDNFVLRIRYRVLPEATPDPELQWNDHHQWGLQEWFTTNMRKNVTYSGGHAKLPEPPGPDPTLTLPSGQVAPTLERVVVLRNGTVLHTGRPDPAGPWPTPGGDESAWVTRVHLGPMAEAAEPAVSGGVVYVPNGRDQVLLLYPKTAGVPARWQIVSKDGRTLDSGLGHIPEAKAASFNFQLRPTPTTRWFLMTSTGTMLRSGTGDIPEAVKNLYAGLTTGKLLKVEQVGEETVQWTLSRPDGSEATGGQGSIPASLRQALKLDEVLRPLGAGVSRWAVLGDSGEVLQAGSGSVPQDVLNKYAWLGSGLVLTDSGAGHWTLQRTDGTRLLQGEGPLPTPLAAYIRGSIVLPVYTQKSSWTVMLPNGTRLSGEGPVPEEIQKLFEAAAGEKGGSSERLSRWFVTDSAGKVLESGYGEAPLTALRDLTGSGVSKVVQQVAVQGQGLGSNLTRWEARSLDGRVLARGEGQPPSDLFKTMGVPSSLVDLAAGDSGTLLTSGANHPGYRFRAEAAANGLQGNVPHTGPAAARVETKETRQWSVTLPDGSRRSGTGEVPPDLAALLANGQGSTSRRWSVTLPDGTQRSGEGEVPADIRALLAGGGGGGGLQVTSRSESRHQQGGQTAGSAGPPPPPQVSSSSSSSVLSRTWSVTMPNGTVRSGSGSVPADLQQVLDAQAAAGNLRTVSRWSVTSPDGTVKSGVGDVPTDIRAMMSQGPERRWRLRMPDGSVRTGRGALPADLTTLLDSARASDPSSLSRSPRAAAEGGAGVGPWYELLGNCGGRLQPSFLLITSATQVRLMLRTAARQEGVTLALPISPGLNDVEFVYNGNTFSGFTNGLQKSVPLSGSILPQQVPVVIGDCSATGAGFRGDIDEVSILSCIP